MTTAETDGRIHGHEGIGVVEQVGTGVSEFRGACIPIVATDSGEHDRRKSGRVRAHPASRRESLRPSGWQR